MHDLQPQERTAFTLIAQHGCALTTDVGKAINEAGHTCSKSYNRLGIFWGGKLSKRGLVERETFAGGWRLTDDGVVLANDLYVAEAAS